MSEGDGGSQLVAIVTAKPEAISGGGVPVFFIAEEKQRERVAVLLAKMSRGMVHDLEIDTYVIVRH